MTNADTRAAIAAAANTVTGINCKPYFRQSTKPGDACVRLAAHARSENGYGFMDTWQVWLVLPQDLLTGEKYLDDHMDTIAAALSAELVITTVTPADLVFGTNPVNGAIFEGVRPDSSTSLYT